jgi:hypothetical protein
MRVTLDIRGYASGRAQSRMSDYAWTIIGIAVGVCLFAILVLHVILLPGWLIGYLIYDPIRPLRGVAVTPSGLAELKLSVLNGRPERVLLTTDLGALSEQRVRREEGRVYLQLGSDTIRLRDADFAVLVASASSPATGVLPSRPDEPIRPTREDVPAWRRASVGWILLHIAIAIALSIAGLAVSFWFAEAFHRDVEKATDVAVSFVLLAFFAIPAGWLLFVYLRRSFRTRNRARDPRGRLARRRMPRERGVLAAAPRLALHQTSPGRHSQLIGASTSSGPLAEVGRTMMLPSSSSVRSTSSTVRTNVGPRHRSHPRRR